MFSRISEVGPNRKLVPSTPRLSFWTVWFRHNPAAAVSHGTGTPSTIFPCFHINFRVKSVSFSFQLQCFYGVKSVSLYWFTMSLPGQISLPLSIYNIFTGSNRYPSLRFTRFLQGQTSFISSFYRVKTVSLYRFTRILQVQTSLPFLIYNVSTGSNQSLFFFRLTRFLRGPINVLIYMMFTRYLHVVRKKISVWRTLAVFVFYSNIKWRGKTENWRKFYFTTPMM